MCFHGRGIVGISHPRRDLLGPCNSSNVNRSWSWTVTCPLTREPCLRTDWWLYLSKVWFQVILSLYFYPSGRSICSFLIPQNMCVFSVNDELSQLSRKVLTFRVRRVISQVLLHAGGLCACHPDALLSLLVVCERRSQYSWRVGFVDGMWNRGHPTVRKYFSVLISLGCMTS